MQGVKSGSLSLVGFPQKVGNCRRGERGEHKGRGGSSVGGVDGKGVKQGQRQRGRGEGRGVEAGGQVRERLGLA